MFASSPENWQLLPLNRVEAFSDGVFAIIVTLLILDVRLPADDVSASNAGLITYLKELFPSVLAFIVSFLTVSIFWLNHVHFLHWVKHANRGFIWLNVVFLMTLAFVPIPTGLLGTHPLNPVAIFLYAVVLAISALMFTVLRIHAMRRDLHIEGIGDALVRAGITKSLLGPAAYLASCALANLAPRLALLIFVVVPVMYLLPIVHLGRHYEN